MTIRLSIIISIITLGVFSTQLNAAQISVWTDVITPQAKSALQSKSGTTGSTPSLSLLPDKYRLLRLDEDKMREELAHKPQSKISYKQANKRVLTSIEIPLPDGTLLPLKVTEASILEQELAAKYPQIQTYQVNSEDNNGIYGVVDVTERGFHAMLFMADGKRLFIDPRSSNNESYYISYYSEHYHPADKKPFQCGIKEHHHELQALSPANKSVMSKAARSGENLRTYRLAMAATGEYTAYHGGTIAGAMSAITTTISRVNVIYQRDLAIKLQLVTNTDQLIKTDTSTYSNSDPDTMLSENQAQLDSVIGAENYDIGHVFSTSFGGVAFVGAVCGTSKAGGVTGSPAPQGDSYDIDMVAHEIAHQFGANHTFNSTTGSCAGGTRNAATAFEPGSGTTILSYSGLCGSNDIQNTTDPMFHIMNIGEITAFVNDATEGGSCGIQTAVSNQQPTVDAGKDYTIPANTPFELTGVGKDLDGDILSYSWEQTDAGTASDMNVDTSDNPIFRVFLPQTSATRIIPELSSILSNTDSVGEKLPGGARTLNFTLAVRDQKGGVNSDDMVVNVSNSNAFKITSHTSTVTLNAQENTTVTWDVASTNMSPINCSSVDILLSTDGGESFANVLDGSTANDGSEVIRIPANVKESSTARLKVKCSDNIFFDISDADLVTKSMLEVETPILANLGSNNVVDPGETISLTIPLTNKTSTPTTDVSGVLASLQSGINVVVANSDYANIQALATINNTTAYQVSVPASHACGADVPLQLSTDFTNASIVANKDFDIVLSTGEARNSSQTVAPAQEIPDGGEGVESEITLSGIGVSPKPALSVDVDITHPYRGDLMLELTSPQGTTVVLKRSEITDNAVDVVGNYPANFTPVESLAAFEDENLDGVWKLKVADSYENDTGTLNSWSLRYTSFSCKLVVEPNPAPQANNSSFSTEENTSITGTMQASDADNDTLTYSLVADPAKGSVVITNTTTGAFTYTPFNGQSGDDSFTFKVNDGKENSNIATITINIKDTIDDTIANNPQTGNTSSDGGGGGTFSWYLLPMFLMMVLLRRTIRTYTGVDN